MCRASCSLLISVLSIVSYEIMLKLVIRIEGCRFNIKYVPLFEKPMKSLRYATPIAVNVQRERK